MKLSGVLLVGVLAAACAAPIDFSKNAEGFLLNTDPEGVMLEGHDAVALVLAGQKIPGLRDHEEVYQGGIYRFSSAENRSAFKEDPARYAPQFGGFCSMAAALGKVEPGSVDFSSVIDGRLVVQRNEKAAKIWNKDPSRYLAKADRQWPQLVAQAPGFMR